MSDPSPKGEHATSLLAGGGRELLTGLYEAAKRHRITVIDAEVDRDHIHVIMALPLTMTPTFATMVLKGISARIILQEVPYIARLYRKRVLWSPGKFLESIGHITLEKAKRYLEEHHAKSTTESPSFRAGRTPSGVILFIQKNERFKY